MTPEQKTKIKEAIAEQHMLRKSESLAGNTVKEQFHKGALFGIKLTLLIIEVARGSDERE